ncbi:class I SAM-dependent methyltransferase [Streptomyces sp. SL13]|uniref:S-adenosyl-L-methionine-dependent methyltransferase n=1 Tax=Streptantibioticus silvisoli TaxID=2705255 RepID=A0AA90H1Y0_9ACTN|nr:class I SAM-dependent methyltransferase [Streptantibioticus silvisoli]MDI5969364.1 class I SAM-dependent methyltransferase [Streptantibioticus silvisoli]
MSSFNQWDIVSGVGVTALGVAAARALETHRSGALVTDPYASAFVEAAEAPVPLPSHPRDLDSQAWKGDTVWMSMATYVAVRSRFFDDFFARATADGIGQAVLLAAGLDTRAFRLDWPAGCRLFEVDQPKVLEFKDTVLGEQQAQARCDRRAVAVDLRDDWAAALHDAGFDTTRPTAWLAEGLLPYLPADAENNLFATIHRLSAPGSRIAVEHVDTQSLGMFDEEEMTQAGQQMGVDISTLLHNEDKEHPERVLTGLGWTARSDTAQQTARRYGRELDGTMGRNGGKLEYITASR